MGFFRGRDTDSGAKTQIYMGGSQTVLGFADQAKKRNRVVMLGLGVGTVLAGFTAFGVMKYLEADAAGRVVSSYSALSRCMLGEPPSASESVSLRFRAMQLTALTQSEIVRATDKAGAWPDRCAKYAHGLAEALDDSAIGATKGKALLEASKELAAALDQKESFWRDVSGPVDRTFTEALKAGVVLQPMADVAAPPARATAMDVDSLAKAGALTDKPVALGEVRTTTGALGAVTVLIDDAKGGVRNLCSITLDKARCAPVNPSLKDTKGALRFVGTADEGAPPLVLGDGRAFGNDGVIATTTAPWAGAVNETATTLVVEGARGPEIIRLEGGRESKSPLGLGTLTIAEPRRDVQLLWGDVVALGSSGKELTMAAAALGDARGPNLEAIGPLPKGTAIDRSGEGEPRVDGCRVAGITVARARVGRDEFVSFQSGGRWSAPRKAATTGGSLLCQQGSAITVHMEGGSGEASLDGKVVFQRCSATECKANAVDVREVFAGEVGLASSTPMALGAIDGKLLMVWQAGQRGGLRYRLADAAAIAKAPDVILFDDLVQNGRVVEGSTLLDMKLVSAERFAVLFVATPAGLRAIRITSDGKATPVSL